MAILGEGRWKWGVMYPVGFKEGKREGNEQGWARKGEGRVRRWAGQEKVWES